MGPTARDPRSDDTAAARTPAPSTTIGAVSSAEQASGARAWTFLTHHALVLLAVAREPDARVADIAAGVGVSTRAALSILGDLEEAGHLQRSRVGRRTHYDICRGRPFRHRAVAGRDVDELLTIFEEHPTLR